jgi:hypothetical protein
MMSSFIVLHPLQLPAGRDLSGTDINKSITWSNRLKQGCILILSKTYPSVITTSPTQDMLGFLATGFLLLKSNKEYVLTFKILSQVLIDLFFSKLDIYCKHKLSKQLIKHNIHQLPSLGISWLVE